ncbi:phosphate acyltransferase PlsX [bacterium]|nr:phosphate acyltransferase PlsX [bacterium]
MITIALDAMGGDHAPEEILKGALEAVKAFPVKIILVGPETLLKKKIASIGDFFKYPQITIKNATQIVEMGESPAQSFKKKPDSSIRVGLNLVKAKKADAFVSAGNTGAVMATSTLVLGRIKNIDRPAIATVINIHKKPFVMLDMGSNVDCKPKFLYQFAVMGTFFCKLILGIDNPRVGLLNIGEEPDKGNALTLATYDLLKNSSLNFIGNIESKEALCNKADVVVCDGFVGNVLLKFGEGVIGLVFDFFKKEWKTSVIAKIALLLLAPALKRFKKDVDYEEIGGAPLLGINGVTIIAHGKSKSKAIKNAIKIAQQAVETNMVEKIAYAE